MHKKVMLGMVSAVAAVSLLAGCSKETEETKVTASVDSISKASTTYFYEAASVQGDDFIAFVNDRKGAVSIATTNEDGSPNLATLVPGITEDGKYLILVSAENQTIKNITEREMAVFEFFNYQPNEEDKMKRNTGARAIVKYDASAQKDLIAKYSPSEGATLLEIVKVIPLG